LRRILLILSIILLTAVQSQAQSSRSTPVTDAVDPIVKLYPNPATTYITFDLQNGFQKGLSIQLWNFLGRKMHETTNVSEKTTIDLSEFTRGVYIYYLVDQSGKVVKSGKFQVSK
jgi:hypothetical protein